MSQLPSRDGRRQPSLEDNDTLPKGACNYKLLHPEVTDQRCGCLGFSLLRSRPGSSCQCGHNAVYHHHKQEEVVAKVELETLKSRMETLERLLEREVESKSTLVVRVSSLEEYNDDAKVDLQSEMRTAYKGVEGLWQHFRVLDRRTKVHEERIETLMDVNHGTQQDVRHLQARLVEVDDASMALEERLDSIDPSVKRRDSSASRSEMYFQPLSRRPRSAQRSQAHRGWTVHISLMPTASQPFPFEKDTIAYKRVLSRGLHRIVSIPGSDSRSFVGATYKAFASLLKGRAWMPLVAKICDAEHLSGLPMLRCLPDSMRDTSLYDFEFLRNNCATLDNNGNILDLYIVMCDESLAWSELHDAPIYMPGLERCWESDNYLDGPDSGSIGFDNEKSEPSAGDLMRAWSPPTTRLKRSATNMSPATSLGPDMDNKRNKITHALPKPLGRTLRTEEAV